MSKSIKEKNKASTEEILSVKTNQDFNKQKPNLNNPNQLKGLPKEAMIDKRLLSKKSVNKLYNKADEFIVDKNKKTSNKAALQTSMINPVFDHVKEIDNKIGISMNDKKTLDKK